MTFPLYIFLFAYAIAGLIIAAFLLINLHHLATGGSLTLASIAFSFFIAMLCIAVFAATIGLLTGTNWQMPLFSDGIQSVFQWGEKVY